MIRLSSADTTTDPGTEETTGGAETDERREALLARFTDLLGDDLVASEIDPGHELWIRVRPEAWKRAHQVARLELDLTFFEFLSAIDWLPSPFGKSEDASVDLEPTDREPGEPEPGTTGGDTRFQVFSRLMDIDERDLAVVVKADVPAEAGPDGSIEVGSVESIVSVFPGANWHEREVHEMYGIGFEGHPYLEKLYLPTDFEGYPLRKDFPLLARLIKPWPGIVDVEPMPEDDEGDDEA